MTKTNRILENSDSQINGAASTNDSHLPESLRIFGLEHFGRNIGAYGGIAFVNNDESCITGASAMHINQYSMLTGQLEKSSPTLPPKSLTLDELSSGELGRRVRAFAISDDNTRIAVSGYGEWQDKIRVFDLLSMQQIAELKCESKTTTSCSHRYADLLRWIESKNILMATQRNQKGETLKFYDMDAGSLLTEIRAPNNLGIAGAGYIESTAEVVAFYRSGNKSLLCFYPFLKGKLSTRAKRKYEFPSYGWYDNSFAMSPDGLIGAIAEGTRSPLVLDMPTGEILFEMLPPITSNNLVIEAMAISHDNRQLAAKWRMTTPIGWSRVVIYDLCTGRQEVELPVDCHRNTHLQFTKNDEKLAVAGSHGIFIWDLENSKYTHEDYHHGSISHIDCNPNSSAEFLSVGEDCKLALWCTSELKPKAVANVSAIVQLASDFKKDKLASIKGALVTEDSSKILLLLDTKLLCLDIQNQSVIWEVKADDGCEWIKGAVAMHKDGLVLAIQWQWNHEGGSFRTTKLRSFRLDNGEEVECNNSLPARASASIARDGSCYTVIQSEGIKVLEIPTYKEILAIQAHCYGAYLSGDGSRLVVCRDDTRGDRTFYESWNCKTGTQLARWTEPDRDLVYTPISYHGKYWISTSRNVQLSEEDYLNSHKRKVELRNIDTGEVLGTYGKGMNPLKAWFINETTIAIASDNSVIKLLPIMPTQK